MHGRVAILPVTSQCEIVVKYNFKGGKNALIELLLRQTDRQTHIVFDNTVEADIIYLVVTYLLCVVCFY